MGSGTAWRALVVGAVAGLIVAVAASPTTVLREARTSTQGSVGESLQTENPGSDGGSQGSGTSPGRPPGSGPEAVWPDARRISIGTAAIARAGTWEVEDETAQLERAGSSRPFWAELTGVSVAVGQGIAVRASEASGQLGLVIGGTPDDLWAFEVAPRFGSAAIVRYRAGTREVVANQAPVAVADAPELEMRRMDGHTTVFLLDGVPLFGEVDGLPVTGPVGMVVSGPGATFDRVRLVRSP